MKAISFLTFLGALSLACDINVALIPSGNGPIMAQVVTQSGKTSPMFTVRAGSNPAYKVTECGNVIIRSFRPVGNNQAGQALNELSASLGGAGRVDYHIDDSGKIIMGNRIGVSCAFGSCKEG